MTSARLAVDIGGTFTDLALEQDGRRFTAKTLTTSDAPEQGVLTGVAAILRDAGLAPGRRVRSWCTARRSPPTR